MNTKLAYKAAVMVLFLSVAGCASKRERQAILRFEEISSATYAPGGDRPAGRELPDLNGQPSLEDYLAYAALNNPGLEAAFYRWKAALERIPQARALPDPRFTYSYYIREVETRVGPQRQAFGLAQTLPWYPKLRLRGEVAFEEAEAAGRRFEAEKLALFNRVKQAYCELYYLARAIQLTRDNSLLISEMESVARARFAAGAIPQSAVLKGQVELGKLEDRLKSLEDLRAPVTARLNEALGRPADRPLPWPGPVREEAAEFRDDQLFDWLREGSPELQALDAAAAKEKAALDAAGWDYVPDLTVGVNVIETGEAVMPGVDDSGKDPVVAGFSVNVPLWYGKYRAAEREAEARLRAAQKSREDRENRLHTELKLALFGFRDAERKIDLYRDTLLHKAEEALASSRTAFAAGKADFFDLIEAERTLLEFQLAHERARADRGQRLAEIEMLVGRRIPLKE